VLVFVDATTEDKIKNMFRDRIDELNDLILTNKVKFHIGSYNAKIGQELIYRAKIRHHSIHEKSYE